MKQKNIIIILLVVILSFTLGCKQTANDKKTDAESKNWTSLFNGKDLSGWTVKIRGQELGVNYKNTFRVVDGVMQVNYDNYGTFDNAFGHIYYDKEFSDYKFRMEYRFLGAQVPGGAGWAIRNSGVMIHCQDPATIALDQNFPVSVEVQLLGGLDEGERSTGNVCTPGTHIMMDDELITNHCISSSSETYNGDQWVTVEILVRHDSIISHLINGKEVIRYRKPVYGGTVDADTTLWKSRAGLPLKSGFISLQSESHPVEFRKIEIFELN